MAEPLPSKQTTRVRFSLPAPTSPRSSSGQGHRSFKSGNAGSNPARGSTPLPLRLAGRAPGFGLGRLGSNPRGAATFQHRGIAQSVERGSHTPRQPQVRSLLPRPFSFCAQPCRRHASSMTHQPCARDAGLAKWEGNGSWPRHEAVRFRQPVRACSSSEERRIPNPRQRGFNSFLARHHCHGRSQRDCRIASPRSVWVKFHRSGNDERTANVSPIAAGLVHRPERGPERGMCARSLRWRSPCVDLRLIFQFGAQFS